MNFETTDDLLIFKILSYICVNKFHLASSKTVNILEISINVDECKIEEIFSKESPSLYKWGSGYYLDLVEVRVIPIEDESMLNKPLYKLKDGPYPNHHEVINSLNDWSINLDECGRTGICWRYKYKAKSIHGDYNRRSLLPGKHSCQWVALKAMRGSV